MCGIAAMVALNGAKIEPDVIERMSNAIKHRGPDAEGNFISDSVGFGFRRLSIIDLSSAANQPMTSDDGLVVIVFNGEIFNYIELRMELQELGYVFRTKSDTEVLLNAYREWGYGCLSKLNGMWAFIIYEAKQGKIFVSRDRFGIKPLYMYRSGDIVFFGSEIKAIIASGYYKGGINWKIASSYLLKGHLDRGSETFYSGIEQIPAGFAFELDLSGRLDKRCYWSLGNLPSVISQEPGCLFFNIFEDAVKIRLRSDVPVGVFLSGGLDSTSIICSIARQNRNIIREKPDFIQAFCYMDEEFDERRYINDTLQLTGACLNILKTDSKQSWKLLNQVMWHNDEPVHSISTVIVFELYKIASLKGIKVVLNGQGSDESLAGYRTYFDEYWYTLLKKGFFRDAWREIGAFCSARGGNRYDFFLKVLKSFPYQVLNKNKIYRNLRNGKQYKEYQENSWFAPEIIKLALQGQETEVADVTLNGQLRYSVERGNLPLYLRIEDRNSMAHSAECRLPFLDHRLISLAFGLPDNWKIRGPWNKYILRESMRSYIPDSVRNRHDKTGFRVSRNKFLANILYEPIQDMLRSNDMRDRKIYNMDRIISNLEDCQKGKVDISRNLFKVIQFELFCQLLKNNMKDPISLS